MSVIDWYRRFPALLTRIYYRHVTAEYNAARKRTPPCVIGEEDAPPPADSVAWTGIPGSPGSATGPAYIVTGVNDFAGFPKGAVLGHGSRGAHPSRHGGPRRLTLREERRYPARRR